MKKLLAIPGYLWAVACFLIIPVTFIRNDSFARQLATLPFMKVHPVYSGGELNRTYEEDSLLVSVNHPVNTTMFGNGKQMVQVTFAKKGALPRTIDQTIDYDFDTRPDFRINVNTTNGDTEFSSLNPNVTSLWASSKVKEVWMIRVNLEK